MTSVIGKGKDVDEMCNLSDGIEERGIEKGIKKGMERGIAEGEATIILKFYNKGFTEEQIAEVTDKSLEEIKNIIEGKEPAFV